MSYTLDSRIQSRPEAETHSIKPALQRCWRRIFAHGGSPGLRSGGVGFQAHGRNALNKTCASALVAPHPQPAHLTWLAQKKLTKKFPKSIHTQSPSHPRPSVSPDHPQHLQPPPAARSEWPVLTGDLAVFLLNIPKEIIAAPRRNKPQNKSTEHSTTIHFAS